MSPLIRSGAVMWHLWKPVTLLLMTTCFSMKSVMSWGTIFSTTFESAGKIDIGRSWTLNAGLSSFAIWGFGFNGWFSKHHAIYGNIVHFPQKTYALNVFRPLMRSWQIYKSATSVLNLLNVNSNSTVLYYMYWGTWNRRIRLLRVTEEQELVVSLEHLCLEKLN